MDGVKVFIAVVSHGHAEFINANSNFTELAKRFDVIIKCNKPDQQILVDKAVVLDEAYWLGFGANNNYIYRHCIDALGMRDSDYFIVCNPDVFLDATSVVSLIEEMRKNKVQLGAINLFRDSDYSIFDNSVRNFPGLLDFVSSYVGLGNSTLIDKSKIDKPIDVDWAAGSFLAFTSRHYSSLGGFDEAYFMYCEDLDICYRSHLLGQRVVFFPLVRAVHFAQHGNRKIFSRHFFWHVSNVIRFLLRKNFFYAKLI